MPNIPNVPGVPPLDSFLPEPLALLVQDVVSALLGIAPQWGVFLDGVPVIEADSTVDFEFKQDFPISTYPVEQGGFQSYDKVQLPAEIRVRYAAGGTEANRQSFLVSIDSNINTTTLYDVVTPEAVYLSYCFTHRDFARRAKNGVGLIIVDLWLEEIRETSAATFTNTQSPAVAGQSGQGNVQPQTPSPFVQQQFDSGNWSVN
jgi:hypothetical protein